MTADNHDSVRYSLLDATEDGCQALEDTEDLYVVRTMTRSSIGPTTVNTFAGRLRGSQRITFLAILLTCFVLILWLLSTNMEVPRDGGGDKIPVLLTLPSTLIAHPLLKSDGSKKASDLRTDLDSKEIYAWHQDNCYLSKELSRSVPDIYKKLQLLKESTKDECRLIWEIFNAIFRIEEIEAPISLPLEFQKEVRVWLDNNEKLFEQVNHQVLYKIINKVTFEETVFNPIRSKRPVSKSLVDPHLYIKNLSDSTAPTCDFCQYKDHTAEDVFGRIDNEFSASCSNTFKLAKFHALFFPKQHFPLNLSLIQIEDIFLHTSQQWFAKAYEQDSNQRYPSLMWDTLPHAGASQVHPHIHGVLDAHQYVGGFESWHQISVQYYDKLKRSFWTDFVKLHFALGLGISSGDAVVLMPLCARKDNEYMILSPNLNGDVTKLIHRVLQTYLNKLNVFCFSSGGVYPVLGDDENVKGMPVIFRFGSRGTCTAIGSDVSSLELYTLNNINSDLAKTYEGLVEEA